MRSRLSAVLLVMVGTVSRAFPTGISNQEFLVKPLAFTPAPNVYLHPLRVEDPTNSIVCRIAHVQGLATVPSSISTRIWTLQELTSSRELDPKSARGIKVVDLRPLSPDLYSLALQKKVDETDHHEPEDALAAPDPFFHFLCVNPERPRPYPVLYANVPNFSEAYPSIASFSSADIIPAVAGDK